MDEGFTDGSQRGTHSFDWGRKFTQYIHLRASDDPRVLRPIFPLRSDLVPAVIVLRSVQNLSAAKCDNVSTGEGKLNDKRADC